MSLVARISQHFRHRRMRWFCATMGITANTRILDVGGSPETWLHLPINPRVTLVNIPMSITTEAPGFRGLPEMAAPFPF